VQASPPVLIASGDPVTVSTADTLTPPAEAVIVTSVLAGTATGVTTVNDADAEPAATVTLAGTPATFRLLLDNATAVAAGAAAGGGAARGAGPPRPPRAGRPAGRAGAGPPPPPPPPPAGAGAAVPASMNAATAASRQRTRTARRPVAYRMSVTPFRGHPVARHRAGAATQDGAGARHNGDARRGTGANAVPPTPSRRRCARRRCRLAHHIRARRRGRRERAAASAHGP